MQAPLPLVYDETALAAGSQVQASMPIGGPTFSADAVQAAAQEAGHVLESQVWLGRGCWLAGRLAGWRAGWVVGASGWLGLPECMAG